MLLGWKKTDMVSIIECNFKNSLHKEALIRLMNNYMADDMGGKLPPYTPEIAEVVLMGLEKHPSKLILFAVVDQEFIGLTNCFVNFGTFAAKPFINIHDVVVLKEFRGRKIGQQLMEGITRKAKELGCSKITLEVRNDNKYAQKLYRKMGYDECQPPMHFWTKKL